MRKQLSFDNSPVSRPIRGYSHKGFIVGWLAIAAVAIGGFAVITLPLGHSVDHVTSAALSTQARPMS